ncbi:MAG: segregation/condensation protein A [Lachnospiraceae bacterium]|nr:segregation/condensation protein A [Lachnospiraceae bacterium]
MSLSVKLQVFEGPLDLLLHLIDINKIDIYDIPISLVTDQYLDYIRQMQELDMDVMSEFLVMAATLLRIKSKMLLPVEPKEEEDGEDPRDELVERLLEHKMYKYMAQELKDKQLDASKSMFKGRTLPPDMVYVEPKVDLDELVGDLDFKKLHQIFLDVLKRQEDKMDPIRSRYGQIEQEEVSLSDRMDDLVDYGRKYRRFSFRQILSKGRSKTYVIVSFLAILELMKSGMIAICQEETFGDIEIEMTGEGTMPEEISFEGV